MRWPSLTLAIAISMPKACSGERVWPRKTQLKQGRLRAVLRDWAMPETTIYAVYPSRQCPAPKLRVFLDFLMAELGGEAN